MVTLDRAHHVRYRPNSRSRCNVLIMATAPEGLLPSPFGRLPGNPAAGVAVGWLSQGHPALDRQAVAEEGRRSDACRGRCCVDIIHARAHSGCGLAVHVALEEHPPPPSIALGKLEGGVRLFGRRGHVDLDAADDDAP